MRQWRENAMDKQREIRSKHASARRVRRKVAHRKRRRPTTEKKEENKKEKEKKKKHTETQARR